MQIFCENLNWEDHHFGNRGSGTFDNIKPKI
jgi:hypothetical protein